MLKPCPFCGNDEVKIDYCEGGYHEERFWGICLSCGAEAETVETKEKAELIWNNRPIENELIEALEEVSKLVLELEFYGYAVQNSTTQIREIIYNAISKAKGEVK